MVEPTSNDNEAAHAGQLGPSPDAHGQAAMLLVESLIHGLVARSVISVADAVEIVDAAAEVKMNIAADLGDTPAALEKSLSMLASIRGSLSNDL